MSGIAQLNLGFIFQFFCVIVAVFEVYNAFYCVIDSGRLGPVRLASCSLLVQAQTHSLCVQSCIVYSIASVAGQLCECKTDLALKCLTLGDLYELISH